MIKESDEVVFFINKTFMCPKCKKEFEKNEHYFQTIQAQNMVNLISGAEEIKDMCMNITGFSGLIFFILMVMITGNICRIIMLMK